VTRATSGGRRRCPEAISSATAVLALTSGQDQSHLTSPVHSEDSAGEFGPPGRVNNAVVWHIDKNALTLSEPRRYHDRAHLRFVPAEPCLICGPRPSDQRRIGDPAVPDSLAIHRHGDEAAWWETNKVDPIAVACEFCQWTLDGPRGERAEALLSIGVSAPRET
jgi:hypothetical protein